jgi:hypothetical protein
MRKYEPSQYLKKNIRWKNIYYGVKYGIKSRHLVQCLVWHSSWTRSHYQFLPPWSIHLTCVELAWQRWRMSFGSYLLSWEETHKHTHIKLYWIIINNDDSMCLPTEVWHVEGLERFFWNLRLREIHTNELYTHSFCDNIHGMMPLLTLFFDGWCITHNLSRKTQ